MLAPPICPSVNGINGSERLAILARLEAPQSVLRRLERISHGAETFANDLTRAFLPADAGPVGQFSAAVDDAAMSRRLFLQANEPVLLATVTRTSGRGVAFRSFDPESNGTEHSDDASTSPEARSYWLRAGISTIVEEEIYYRRIGWFVRWTGTDATVDAAVRPVAARWWTCRDWPTALTAAGPAARPERRAD